MHPVLPRQSVFLVVLLSSVACAVPADQSQSELDDAFAARAAALELDTNYHPPPGQDLHHHTSGFAKILCSAVFITGLDAQDAAANVGGFTSPFDERNNVVDTVVDYEPNLGRRGHSHREEVQESGVRDARDW